jgi:hypothetical protein
MSFVRHTRAKSPVTRALDLPPPFRLVMLREVGDAFMHARAHAAELGAGTLICVGRFDVAELAVVLEPDEPLGSAWRVFYAGMVALTDALAAWAPPEKPIAIAWPDALRLDGRLVGGGRLAWPDGADDAERPPWLVFGAMIRTDSLGGDDPGQRPFATAPDDEGFRDIGSGGLVESFARHLMRVIDRWRDVGFTAIAEDYASRLERQPGVHHAIGDRGELSVTRAGKPVEHRRLHLELATPSWLDPRSGEPRA